jgi:hypothetical protein
MVTKLREQLDRVGTTGWLAVLAVLAFLRSPHVLLEGRFWAEEGSIHFAHAYAEGGIAGLTFIDQRAGYLNLIPNVGTWLATLVPLSVAPLVTTWLAFGVLLFVLWIAVAWPSDLLPTPGARLIAAGLLLFGPAAHPEVWLNTINSQTHLGIAGILLAFVRLDDLSRRRFHLSVTGLVVAALSGLYFLLGPSGGYQGGSNPNWDPGFVFSRTTWDLIHTWSGTVMIIAAVLHFAIHWRWVKNVTRRFFLSLWQRPQRGEIAATQQA